MSGFENIELAKKGILAHQQGMGVVGHNLANAGTQGYSRQKVTMATAQPLTNPGLGREERAGQIGQGVNVVSIKRVKDEILEGRIDALASSETFYKTKEKYLSMVSNLYNEPEDASTRKAMDNFWMATNELSMHPSEQSARVNVLETANTLTESVSKRYYNLKGIKDDIELELKENVGRVNEFLSQIADLNRQIQVSEKMGDNPNDLLDKRDAIAENLGKIINITVDKRDGEYKIHLDGQHLLIGNGHREIVAVQNSQNEGYVDLKFKDTNAEFLPKSGSLGALIVLRDGEVNKEIKSLDNMIVNFVAGVNDLHKKGSNVEGQSGINFFKEFPFVNNAQGSYDKNGDGQFDSTYLFSVKGQNNLQASEQVGLNGTITLPSAGEDIQVNYYTTDTVRDVILKINHSGADVNASLDSDGKLILKATPSSNKDNPDFVLRNFSDSGDFLAGYSGILQNGVGYNYQQANSATALTGTFSVSPIAHPAAYFALSDEVKGNASKISAGLTSASGDGKIAQAIASLRSDDIMLGKTASFDNYFADTIANAGIMEREAMTMREEKELNLKDLRDYRESISGVNINEEIADMMKFQHGYNASARFLVSADKMLETIINLK